MKPQLYTLDEMSLAELKTKTGAESVTDTLLEQLEDLFLIRNPQFKFIPNHDREFEEFQKSLFKEIPKEKYGVWVYFSWLKSLNHILCEDEWYETRTGRNQNLITAEEQKKFYDTTIGIAGLSVGSHIALTIAMMGGAKKMVLADPDELSLSNLNRIKAGISSLGKKKINLLAEQIYEMNPYADLVLFSEGITEENVASYFDSGISLLIEETDNLYLKILLRIEARKRKIPVIMGTDNGDGAIIDVERFDIHPDLLLFNGAIGDISIEEFQKFLPQDLPKLATKIAGPELAVPRMKDSLLEVGKTIYSWPQLGSAATLCGSVIAYTARRIATKAPLREGKFSINIDTFVDPNYSSPESISERKEHHKNFMNRLGF